jgi:LacI family transcriptional regulator
MESVYRGFQDLPKIIRERNADGVVFLHIVSPKMVKDLVGRGIPVVCVDPEPAVRGVDTLHFDARRGGMLAAEHLILLGHRNLGFLVGALQQPSIRDRLQGFRDALEKYGLPFDERKQVFECEHYSYHSAYERTVQAIQKYPKLTGLVCANDEMAAGALRGAHELGLRVPRDLSVVGFDDITMANFTDPPLTTVRVDKDLLGRRAMARIIELVEAADRAHKVGARSDAAKQRATREVLPVELIVRESTAKPRH